MPTINHNPSNVGKWDAWYKDADAEKLYGDDDVTYRIAAEFLADCDCVEDRGCGLGGFRRFCKTRYVGVDGSASKFADIRADLAIYTSSVEGVLLRHVIEHNYQWQAVLRNALTSATKKLALVLFTPFAEETKFISYDPTIDVFDISFAKADIVKELEGLRWELLEGLVTKTQYGVEHVFKIEKPVPTAL